MNKKMWLPITEGIAIVVLAGVLATNQGSQAKVLQEKENELAAVQEQLVEKDAEIQELSEAAEQVESEKTVVVDTLSDILDVPSEKIEKELQEDEQEFLEKETKYQQQIQALQEQVDELKNARSTIIANLQEKFDNTDVGVLVDEKTGIISLDTDILFGFGESELTLDGMVLLNEFFPKYIDVVLSDEVRDYVSEVIIEGFTDQRGSYLSNMLYSQWRAYSVAEYCLNEETGLLNWDQREKVNNMLSVNGRSYNDPVLDENGEIDHEASRRVEVKFRMISDELLTNQ